jgi:hypothetical protein
MPEANALPSRLQIERMRLAYRGATLSDDEAQSFRIVQRDQVAILVALAAAVGLGVYLGRVRLDITLLVVGAISVIAAVVKFSRRQPIVKPLLALPLLVAAARLVAVILQYRLACSAIVVVAAIYLLRRYGSAPLDFYQEWMFADPRLRPQTKAAQQVERIQPTVWPLLLLAPIAVLVPLRHTTTLGLFLTLLLLVAILVFFAIRSHTKILPAIRDGLRHAAFIQHLYLAYPDYRSYGIWQAPETLAQRKKAFFRLAGSVCLLLVIPFTFCCPWEIFAVWFIPGFEWPIPPASAARGYDWLAMPFLLVRDAELSYLWCFVVALPLFLLLPQMLLFACYFPAIQRAEEMRRRLMGADSDARTQWERDVEHVATSRRILEVDPHTQLPSKTEAEHLFLGNWADNGLPALLDRAIVREHGYITGQSGSGKTALGIAPLLIQLIRGHDQPALDPATKSFRGDWRRSDPVPILILDLKGDPALFHTVRKEAEGRQPFRYFTIETNRATHLFDPFQNLVAERTPIELCELLIQALSLYHGDFYGASYYSKQNRDLLLTVLKEAQRSGRPPDSWKDLYDRLLAFSDDYRFRDTLELLATIHALCEYPQLAAGSRGPQDADVIHMPTVVENSQIAYFWLPAQITGMSVREIGKLALYSFMTAVGDTLRAGKPKREAYIVIDEFQRIAAENLAPILELARGSGIGVILANQDPGALLLPKFNLRRVVMTNTRFKQYFTVTSRDEIEELMLLSGEESVYMHSHGVASSTYSSTTSESWHETLRSRLNINDIISISDDRQGSILYVTRGSGLTQLGGVPTPLRTPWPTFKDEYDRRDASPWPTGPEAPRTVVSPLSPEEIAQKEREYLQNVIGIQDAIAKALGQLEPDDPTLFDEAQRDESRKKRGQKKGKGAKKRAEGSTEGP